MIRSVAAAGFSSGEAKRFVRDLRTKPELTAARQSYWDRLLIGPDRLPRSGRNFISKIEQFVAAYDKIKVPFN